MTDTSLYRREHTGTSWLPITALTHCSPRNKAMQTGASHAWLISGDTKDKTARKPIAIVQLRHRPNMAALNPSLR